MSDDMSFCMDECERTECERHPSNIVERSIPHSYMHFKGTEFCQRMTREEAVEVIKNLQINIGRRNGKHLIQEAMDMAIEALEQYEDAFEHGYTEAESKYREILERKHGKWIEDRLCSTIGGTYGVRRCSICEDYFQDIGYGWNYCPHCGAKMEGAEE